MDDGQQCSLDLCDVSDDEEEDKCGKTYNRSEDRSSSRRHVAGEETKDCFSFRSTGSSDRMNSLHTARNHSNCKAWPGLREPVTNVHRYQTSTRRSAFHFIPNLLSR